MILKMWKNGTYAINSSDEMVHNMVKDFIEFYIGSSYDTKSWPVMFTVEETGYDRYVIYL